MASPLSTPSESRSPAFVHVDCDGLWAVRSCYGAQSSTVDRAGDPFWREGIPAALDLFTEAGLPATFFVIALDLEVALHRELSTRLLAAGHEIASHSMTHAMALRSAPPQTVRDEVRRSRDKIQEMTGHDPAGFRAPGFSFQPLLLREVLDAGHCYDSSMFPSPWGPALRVARRLLGRGSEARQEPYGSWRDGKSRRDPHWVFPHGDESGGRLMEIPVSLTPRLRLPAHASFALLRRDERTRRVIEWHAARALPLVWVIHLIDLCDTARLDLPVPRWGRRLLCLPAGEKRARLRRMLGWIGERFAVQRTDRWVQSQRDGLADPRDRGRAP
jgi:peptidoglycan/xylan/chitin deacetylase (PgdA/CDA1 family)